LRIGPLLIAASAWAEDSPSVHEVYEVRAPADDRHPGAAVAVVDLDENAGAQMTVAEAIDAIPGVQIRSTGGLGAYSALSVRGSAPSQATVYLDGVPIHRGAFGAVDLSQFAVAGLERIEVWRGLPPPDRMGAGFGGVVDLITRRGDGGEARAMGGSFGTRGAALRAGDTTGAFFATGTGSYLGSEGDFAYLDHNGTPSDDSDDAWRTRRNNGFDQVDVTLHARHDGPLWARATQNLFSKTQGVPGPLTTATDEPHLEAARSVSRLELGRPGRLTGAAYLTVQGDHYRDPNNEIGLGAQDQRSRTWAAGGELRGTWPMGPTALVVVPQVHHERYAQDDVLASGADLEARRWVLGGAVFDVVSLAGERLVLEPAVRVDRYADEADGAGKTHVLISPRGGARFAVTGSIDLRASAGAYHRAPAFLETFGDRGFLVGNPDLRPERGAAGDAGVVWRGPVRLEVGAHLAEVDDLILLVQNSQGTLQARNARRARLFGTEASVAMRGKTAGVIVSYAYLSATNLDDGRRLPGRARHEGYARADLGPLSLGAVRATLYGDVDASAGSYLDAANLRPLPPRAFVGAGVGLGPRAREDLTVTLEGKNLTDANTETVELLPSGRRVRLATQEYTGYPLPGRAFYATARMTF
jgi:iron complex outermembrane receptor protein